jgi:hypothetical protein
MISDSPVFIIFMLISASGYPVQGGGPTLYTLNDDVGESKNWVDQYPEITVKKGIKKT